MTEQLQHYVCGEWMTGEGESETLMNPATEEPIAEVCRDGLPYEDALAHARNTGNPDLRNRTFAERAELLDDLSGVIHEHRDDLLDLATRNGGNTRGDAKFDVDGAMFTLSHYADLGRELGDRTYLDDGELEQLGRSPRYAGAHIRVPLTGAAVQINAYNFPAWGFGEKTATALLAGMPVVTKPATTTAPLAAAIAERVVEADVLPDGAFTFIAGGRGRNLVDALEAQDVLSFTGSARTGAAVRGQDHLLEDAVRVNVEADSLNAAVVAPDIEFGTDTYDLFLLETVREMTQKAGQKCTATRRVFVPEEMVDRVLDDLADELSTITVGNPAEEGVDMGPLVSEEQYESAKDGLEALRQQAEVVHRGESGIKGVDGDRGFFLQPHLLHAPDPEEAEVVHNREVFGPVCTVMPYSGDPNEAAELVRQGKGTLVSSVYTNDTDFVTTSVREMAPYTGRLHLAGDQIKEQSTGPGMVTPALVHGGPGRAGGGEELGGLRGLEHYMQRTALQGFRPLVESLHEEDTDN